MGGKTYLKSISRKESERLFHSEFHRSLTHPAVQKENTVSVITISSDSQLSLGAYYVLKTVLSAYIA